MFVLPEVSDEELLALESRVQEAQRRRSIEGMTAFGFGEVSIALGWPSEAPRFVAKRLIPMDDAARVDAPLAAIDAYVGRFVERGHHVLPTQTRRVERPDGRHVGYVLQPVVAKDQLAETVLKTEAPAVAHPLLLAVREFVEACGGDGIMLDAQIPNFTWVDGKVSLLDVTSPGFFDQSAKLDNPMADMSNQLVPAVLRPAMVKATDDILQTYRGFHNQLTQVCVFLYRVNADAWVPPAIETFNEVLDVPIDAAVVLEKWEKNKKDFPKIKKLLQMQRAWQEKVRRVPYEYLITDSFTGEVL